MKGVFPISQSCNEKRAVRSATHARDGAKQGCQLTKKMRDAAVIGD